MLPVLPLLVLEILLRSSTLVTCRPTEDGFRTGKVACDDEALKSAWGDCHWEAARKGGEAMNKIGMDIQAKVISGLKKLGRPPTNEDLKMIQQRAFDSLPFEQMIGAIATAGIAQTLETHFCQLNVYEQSCPKNTALDFLTLYTTYTCDKYRVDPDTEMGVYMNWGCEETFDMSAADAQSLVDGQKCHLRDKPTVMKSVKTCFIKAIKDGGLTKDVMVKSMQTPVLPGHPDGSRGNPMVEKMLAAKSKFEKSLKDNVCMDPAEVLDCIGLKIIEDECSKEKACAFRSVMAKNAGCDDAANTPCG